MPDPKDANHAREGKGQGLRGGTRLVPSEKLFASRAPLNRGDWYALSGVTKGGLELVGKTILAVDDDIITQNLLRSTLSQAGYSVVVASNGEEGIQKASEQPPDLIILDIMMPGMADIEIYDAECLSCHKEWRVVKHADGRTEIREKTES